MRHCHDTNCSHCESEAVFTGIILVICIVVGLFYYASGAAAKDELIQKNKEQICQTSGGVIMRDGRHGPERCVKVIEIPEEKKVN